MLDVIFLIAIVAAIINFGFFATLLIIVVFNVVVFSLAMIAKVME